jgi:hypothetical protein
MPAKWFNEGLAILNLYGRDIPLQRLACCPRRRNGPGSQRICFGEDVGHYGGSYKVTKDLYRKYGEMRLLDTPICENSFTGLAIGAAMTGLRRWWKG